MSNMQDQNNNSGKAVNSSLAFKLKRFLLQGFLELNKDFRRNIRRRGNMRFKVQLLDKKVPKAYKEAAKAPIDENKVIFVEVRHDHITNSLEVMFDEITNNYDYTVHTHFLLNNATTRADYEKRCLDAVRDIATAKYVFTDEASNVLSAMPLREGTKIVQLWHGCGAFKKFGFSTADLLFGDDRKEQLKHPFYKNYSLVSVSSPEVIWAYNEAMNIDEKSGIVQATGSSRTDIFYNENFKKSSFDRVYDVVPQARGKKIILYAPTFRGRVAKAQAPDMLNVKMFFDAFGEDYVLLFKYHPLVKNPPSIPDEFKNFAVDVSNTLTIEDLIVTSDICISDYSSLVFEYSLFERPLIFFAFDLDEYFDWRGFYYDYFELAPGLVAKTNFEMIDYIKNIDTRFDKKAIQDFRHKFMRSCDGHATERIMQATFDDLESHRKPCDNFENYHVVPKVESSLNPYYLQVKKIASRKKQAESIYAAECEKAKKTDGIIALDISSKAVRYMLRKKGKDSVKLIKSNDLSSALTAIAGAKHILIDRPNTLLDSLEIRENTNVILLPPSAFPLECFGKSTMQYRSNLKKEQYALAPLYSSVSAVTAPSSQTAEKIKFAMQKDARSYNIGDLRTDVFFDSNFKKRSLEKLYEAYPKLEGRKIIAYIPKGTDTLQDSFIYEYLYKDYVLIRSFEEIQDEKKNDVNYYADSIVNVNGILTDYQILAIADIVVTDFNSQAFSFMASGKPLIVYCKNAQQAINSAETLVDIKDVCPTPIFTDTMEVVNEILDIDNYDYSSYNQIREKYLGACTGKSTENLISELNQ